MEHQAYKHQGLKVTGIDPEGIAASFDLPPNSRLVMVNGEAMPDLFAFRLIEGEADLALLFWQEEEGLFEIDVEKDVGDLLGIELEIVTNEIFTHCHNGCVFCFIDQLPKGMRETLYFKDDDMRLSFLHGNYITLTNMTEQELDRLISLRFSPLNVSVHTTDPDLRVKMMRNRFAGNILDRLRQITDAGIDLNIQIVLCPDLNDKADLERTFDDLQSLNKHVRSVACVPVGLTRYRKENNLFVLRTQTPAECRDLIDSVNRRQKAMLEKRGIRLFYLADEFYLKGGVALPSAAEYDDFYQLENGVGMVSRFRADFGQLVKTYKQSKASVVRTNLCVRDTLIVTGRLAAPILSECCAPLKAVYGVDVHVVGVENHFFGQHITVAGLLTGRDIMDALLQQANIKQTRVLLPENMLKSGTESFLDDLTVDDLRRRLGTEIQVLSQTADGLWQAFSGEASA